MDTGYRVLLNQLSCPNSENNAADDPMLEPEQADKRPLIANPDSLNPELQLDPHPGI